MVNHENTVHTQKQTVKSFMLPPTPDSCYPTRDNPAVPLRMIFPLSKTVELHCFSIDPVTEVMQQITAEMTLNDFAFIFGQELLKLLFQTRIDIIYNGSLEELGNGDSVMRLMFEKS